GGPDPATSVLRERLAALVAQAPGRVGVSVCLHDGRRVDVDSVHVVPAASTIKVAVLVAALQACQDGRLALDTLVTLPPPDRRVGGGGPVELLPSVGHLPLLEVLTLMTCLSDNDATNAVIDLVGPPSVAVALAAVPTSHTHLRRRLMDLQAAAAGVDNTTTARDLVDVLVALREGRLLDPHHTQRALEVMQRQQFREGLPAYLPEWVPVASKTGSLHGVRSDMALIEPFPGRYAAVAVVATGLVGGGRAGGSHGSDRGTAVLPLFAEVGELVAALVGEPRGPQN
ncbi:MAG: class A beta-lactamase-related serine hydrolase, partial [Actinomycetota bacterium]|nr:class A beta-lactamase-related serine hydrolase [Actinomycetota bacterium]